MATQYDLSIDQGTTWSRTLTLKDSSDDPIDLTNYTAAMMVRADYDKAALLTATTENNKIDIVAAEGTITITFLPADTTALSFHGDSLDCVYDVEIYNAGVVTRIVQGSLTISREVTRS